MRMFNPELLLGRVTSRNKHLLGKVSFPGLSGHWDGGLDNGRVDRTQEKCFQPGRHKLMDRISLENAQMP